MRAAIEREAQEPKDASALDTYLSGTNALGQPRRIVKIAPGPGAMFWDECFREGYICVGWDGVGDLLNYTDKEGLREAFDRAGYHSGSKSIQSKKANELWLLRELVPGDIVVANRGIREIVALGKVVEGYRWNPARQEYQHTVRVDWDTSFACSVPTQQYWATVTLLELRPGTLRQLMREAPIDTAGLAVAPSVRELQARLEEAGLHYSQETLSAYLLALRAKRFVILTGISGTGKTRLALEVARQVGSESTSSDSAGTLELAPSADNILPIRVHPYMLKYTRMVIPKALQKVLGFPEAARTADSIEVEWPQGQSTLRIINGGTAIFFRGEFRRWVENNVRVGSVLILQVIENGDERPRLRVELGSTVAPLTTNRPRYTVVPVRPDWTDNRGLLGYYNPILQEYVATDFLRLLLAAAEEEKEAKKQGREAEPHFVILDEMNLARVEHYFSDFLSAFESGEPIELHDDDDVESGEKGDLPVPKRLRLPRNLFFTGTVNVDETTYMFSPKVLDRAFVMELNEVDLLAFGDTSEQEDDGLRITHFPSPLTGLSRKGAEDWRAFGALGRGALQRKLIDLHDRMKAHGRHFGYRVAFEVARFVALAYEHGDKSDTTLWRALDLAILFKVLPKLHGTQQELDELLRELFAFATESEADFDAWSLEGSRIFREGQLPPHLPDTAAKVYRMAETLRRRSFASFIE